MKKLLIAAVLAGAFAAASANAEPLKIRMSYVVPVGNWASILYEKKDNHRHAGMSIGYADGHIEWKPMPQAEQEIARSAAATKAKAP